MYSFANGVIVLGVIVITLMGLNGSFSTASIVNPTAQQSIENRAFMLFTTYAAIALAVIFASVYTKRMDVFFILISMLSLFWYITGKTWQA